MSDRRRTAVVILLWALCCEPLAVAGQAAAQSVEPFYKGRTVTMLVGTSPGGINDISARLTARHLSRFIPGNPNIIVQNNPGGGGLVTANRLFFSSGKVHLAWQPVVLCRRRLPDADQRQSCGQHHRRPQGARHFGGAGRRQCGVEQFDFRRHREGGARPQRERGPRLYRCGPAVSRHAARRARRPDGGPELGPDRPARSLE